MAADRALARDPRQGLAPCTMLATLDDWHRAHTVTSCLHARRASEGAAPADAREPETAPTRTDKPWPRGDTRRRPFAGRSPVAVAIPQEFEPPFPHQSNY